LSILMPVHNGALYLEEALASLAAQSFADFELVVVDNASTDATPRLLARWAEREPRLRTLRLERNRLSASLNQAARLARAPILARLDADDVARADRLERQMAALAEQPALGLLGSSATLIDGAGRHLGEVRPPRGDRDIRQRHRTSCGIIPSSSIMRAEVFWAAGGYREGLNISEDFDLWLRMGERCSFANLPEPLISYRIHTASVTARQPVRMALASFCVSAAAEARRTGQAEPFCEGRPRLRAALPLLGLSRKEARKIVRYRSLSNMVSRRLLGLPLPPFLRALSPKLVTRLRLRPLYQAWLRRGLERGP
jgi:glycosyltransferase involved in cell wall biosynthesis